MKSASQMPSPASSAYSTSFSPRYRIVRVRRSLERRPWSAGIAFGREERPLGVVYEALACLLPLRREEHEQNLGQAHPHHQGPAQRYVILRDSEWSDLVAATRAVTVIPARPLGLAGASLLLAILPASSAINLVSIAVVL